MATRKPEPKPAPTAKKKPTNSGGNPDYLTQDDLAPILEKLGQHDTQLADHEERVTALEEGSEVEPPAPDAPPDKTIWEAHMIEYGVKHGEYLLTQPYNLDHVYYDQARAMYGVAEYTGDDAPWLTYAKKAIEWYRDAYVLPNNGAVPGYWNFTTGLRLDYERTGDAESKRAAILLSQNAMYAQDWVDPTYVATHARSREVAYAILGYINAEALGEAPRQVRADHVARSYTYIEQWQDEAAWGTSQISPFMFAITAQALIADWEETHDPRCLPALQQLADWMWPLSWHEPTSALYYNINPNIDPSEGGPPTTGAVDLNALIMPWFSWLWAMTEEVQYRDKFDALLYGAKDSYLDRGKQWNQNYWWSYEGLAWREETGPQRA